jgi:uncharacterized membrane protein
MSKKQKNAKELRAYSHKVSLMKTFSWRIIATLTTIMLAWIFTGEIDTALKIGGVEFFAKMLFYYMHERSWCWILLR